MAIFNMVPKNLFNSSSISIAVILTISCWIHTSVCVSTIPADHLIPPPLPNLQRLANAQTSAYNEFKAGVEPAHRVNPKGSSEKPGFMTRIARWFGLPTDVHPREQQLTDESQRQTYYYPNSNKQEDQSEPCFLCNKAPWIPMMAPSIQYPLANTHQQYYKAESPTSNVNNLFFESVTHQRLPNVQRSVKFSYSPPIEFQSQYFNRHESTTQASQFHITPAELRATQSASSNSGPSTAQLYQASPFHFTSAPPTTDTLYTKQQLPFTEFTNFNENIGAHSELQYNRIIPTQISTTSDGGGDSVEIIKSQQISHFVSSVEYPVTFVQTKTVDVDRDEQIINNPNDSNSINSVVYQQLKLIPNASKYTPASEILTQPTSFVDSQTLYQEVEPLSPHRHTESATQSIVNSEYLSEDNFPSASSHNATQIRTTNTAVWDVEQNELYYTTLEPPSTREVPQISTQPPLESKPLLVTERAQETNVEVIPSLEIKFPHKKALNIPIPSSEQRYRERATPKRLLDSPIQHVQRDNGKAHPFTLDPGKLNLRLVGLNSIPQEFHHPNHDYTEAGRTKDAGFSAPTTQFSLTEYSDKPTPTSTYSAIDASGQFAGMAPPAPSTLHQILIPYTTQSRPRPFKATSNAETTTMGNHFQQQYAEFQQESKLVNTVTKASPKTPYTPKYLTKILASNLRELLKHEQESKNRSKSFDLSKLQRNIDGWTEQEYTSLSHLPSTPTIRGRSKHIPFEYLTTPAPTTNSRITSALPTSINSLENDLLVKDMERAEYASISDNSLLGFFETKFYQKEREFATTTPKPWTSSTDTFTPYYVRAVPMQNATGLWHTAKVSISPQTKEKVYVVTPQPRFFPQRMWTTSTEAPPPNTPTQILNINKAPRFVVRPTPGNNTSGISGISGISGTSQPFYTPDIFGLMGLSAYVPEKPIEIIDGNSKVATVVSPAVSKSSAVKKKMQQKQTMSPLPR